MTFEDEARSTTKQQRRLAVDLTDLLHAHAVRLVSTARREGARAGRCPYPRKTVPPEQWIKYAWLEDERACADLTSGCLGVAIGTHEAAVKKHLAIDEGSRRDATVHEASQMSESDFGNDVVQNVPIGEALSRSSRTGTASRTNLLSRCLELGAMSRTSGTSTPSCTSSSPRTE